MNYTTKKSSVIFELPLSDYFGKSRRYNYKTKEHKDLWLNSVQDYEESVYEDFNLLSYEYLPEDLSEYKDKAIKYLLSLPGKYTIEEIETAGTLEDDIKHALSNAYDNNYQSEWINRFFSMTQDEIDEDLQDNLKNLSYKLLDRLDDEEFKRQRTDQEYLRLEISKQDIKNWLKENYLSEDWHKDKDYIDYFADYALDFERKPIKTEYVDYYNSMGSYDNWLDCFKDMQETTSAIDKYREDEASKIDNPERASLELKDNLTAIDKYAAKYFTKEETRKKIARQVNALKSVIKNAV